MKLNFLTLCFLGQAITLTSAIPAIRSEAKRSTVAFVNAPGSTYRVDTSSACTPIGYIQAFNNLTFASNAATAHFIVSHAFSTYDPLACAKQCDALSDCQFANIYYQNKTTGVSIYCTSWNIQLDITTATNQGGYTPGNTFYQQIAGSNGYSKSTISASNANSCPVPLTPSQSSASLASVSSASVYSVSTASVASVSSASGASVASVASVSSASVASVSSASVASALATPFANALLFANFENGLSPLYDSGECGNINFAYGPSYDGSVAWGGNFIYNENAESGGPFSGYSGYIGTRLIVNPYSTYNVSFWLKFSNPQSILRVCFDDSNDYSNCRRVVGTGSWTHITYIATPSLSSNFFSMEIQSSMSTDTFYFDNVLIQQVGANGTSPTIGSAISTQVVANWDTTSSTDSDGGTNCVLSLISPGFDGTGSARQITFPGKLSSTYNGYQDLTFTPGATYVIGIWIKALQTDRNCVFSAQLNGAPVLSYTPLVLNQWVYVQSKPYSQDSSASNIQTFAQCGECSPGNFVYQIDNLVLQRVG